ncbi:MAG: (2Fe-2S)-binding protein [Spirochaetales bacterium]|nr:(2Fe-2S)-binding protein [Spirochaetales bacterium]
MRRIEHHPILGDLAETSEERIPITVDGKTLYARKGEMIAAALMANGISVFRKTEKKKSPRGIFCGIGRCTDCVMIVNGIPNVRTCVTPVEENMIIRTQEGSGEWGDTGGKT